ncbi:MAG TPA: hypothetical protein VN026_15805 [Bacteroidia bacterium]|jgi:hypothetical protein|nr:hypothetical protein [Bacteroidia bacterium]
MKKLTLLLVVFFAICFASCRKDRTCTCDSTTTTTGPTGVTVTTTSDKKTLKHVNKSEGRVNCMSLKYSFEYVVSTNTYNDDIVRKCTLS